MHDLGGKKNCRKKGLIFGHVGFVLPQKHCSEFFSLGCSSFLRIKVCKKGTQVIKAECFLHAQYLASLRRLNTVIARGITRSTEGSRDSARGLKSKQTWRREAFFLKLCFRQV